MESGRPINQLYHSDLRDDRDTPCGTRDGGRLLLATETDPQGSSLKISEVAAHLTDSAAHFLYTVQGGDDGMPLCGAEVCRDAQEILEAGLISSRDGREIALPVAT